MTSKFDRSLEIAIKDRHRLMAELKILCKDFDFSFLGGNGVYNIVSSPSKKAERNTVNKRTGEIEDESMGFSITASKRNSNKKIILEARIGKKHFTSTYLKGISGKGKSKGIIFDDNRFLLVVDSATEPEHYHLIKCTAIPKKCIFMYERKGSKTRIDYQGLNLEPYPIEGKEGIIFITPSINESLLEGIA